jgi:hypothetical protein
MKRFVMGGLLAATLGLAGCSETGKYPGGDQCKPTDPVQKLDVKDCTVPGS